LSKRDQRRAAEELEACLYHKFDVHVQITRSRSHSRGMVGAALAAGPGRPLGLDLEWMDAARDWREIAAWYFGGAAPDRLDLTGFYRAWTFGEAWFKAVGTLPASAAWLAASADLGDRGVPFAPKGGLCALHRRIGADFMLCLVWDGRPAPAYQPG
jgi:hypothetical protein